VALGVPLLEVEGRDVIASGEVRTFIYVETTSGCAQYLLLMETGDWQQWDGILKNPEKSFRLRWGYATGEEETWAKYRTVRCDYGTVSYAGAIIQPLLKGFDAGYALQERAAPYAYTDKLVSEIVMEIAKRYGLKTDVKATKGKVSLHQCTLPDAYFIQYILKPLAVGSDGRSDYYFFIENGDTLVFRPPELTSVETYSFDLRVGGPRSLRVWVNRGDLASNFSLSTEVRGFDAYAGESEDWIANDNTVSLSKLSSKYPTAPRKPSRVILSTSPEEDASEVELEAKAIWGQSSRSLYQVKLRMEPQPLARPATVVTLKVTDPDGKPHYTTGKYLVHKVKQIIRAKGSGASTELYLERRGREE